MSPSMILEIDSIDTVIQSYVCRRVDRDDISWTMMCGCRCVDFIQRRTTLLCEKSYCTPSINPWNHVVLHTHTNMVLRSVMVGTKNCVQSIGCYDSILVAGRTVI
jgi:hypothetical protein